MNTYVLKTGEKGAERLDVLNEIFGPYSRAYLMDIGLKKGMQVLEVGCGTGSMTVWIAKHVGTKGSVLAVDASEAQIKQAKHNVKQAGVKNITFKQIEAEKLNSIKNTFDFVYSRFLLMHLLNPPEVLKKMLALLKSGGILACEEPTTHSFFVKPGNKIFSQLNKAFLFLAQKQGLDFNIGDRLPLLLLQLPCELIKPRFIQPLVSIALAKDVIRLGAKEIHQRLIKENILSQKEFTKLWEAFEAIPEDKIAYYAFPRHAQIAGIKF